MWNHMSIRRQMAGLALTAVLFTAVVLTAFGGMIYRQVRTECERTVADAAESAYMELGHLTQRLHDTAETLAFTSTIQEFLWARDALEYREAYDNVDPTLIVYGELQPGVTDVALEGLQYSRQGKKITDAVETLPKADDIEPVFSNVLSGTGAGSKPFICVSVAARSLYSNAPGRTLYTWIGQVYVLSLLYDFNDYLGLTAADDRVTVRITDGAGTVIASQDSRELNTKAPDPETGKFIYTQKIQEMSGYCVTATMSAEEVGKAFRRAFMVPAVTATGLILLFVAILLSYYGSFMIPVKKAISSMEATREALKNGAEQEPPMLRLTGSLEYVRLGETFTALSRDVWDISRELVQTRETLHRTELLKTRTRMAMLMSQINPHFLYNTLETIKGMAYMARSPQIAKMTGALGSMFRYCIKSPEKVRVREELANLENYFVIQRARFADRFSMEIFCEEELLEVKIPKMILQPLCENAVFHGLEMLERKGTLKVTGTREGEDLVLRVEDTGLGMSPETLRTITESLADESPKETESESHIGIANVHARIRLHYGVPYGLSVESVPGEGTTVIVRIPLRSEEDV